MAQQPQKRVFNFCKDEALAAAWKQHREHNSNTPPGPTPQYQGDLQEWKAAQTLTYLFQEGFHDFHDNPGLSNQLLLIERRDWMKDSLLSVQVHDGSFISMDCLWYVQAHRLCKISSLSVTADAAQAMSAQLWAPEGFVQVSEDHACVNDIVVYCSSGLPNHIGVLVSRFPDIVVSKFTHGHVYRHPIGLVPAAYGPHVTFYKKALACDSWSSHPFPCLRNMERWVRDYGIIFAVKISDAEIAILAPFFSHHTQPWGQLQDCKQSLYATPAGFLDDAHTRDQVRSLLSIDAVSGQDLQMTWDDYGASSDSVTQRG